MRVTIQAVRAALGTVGSLPPESGAALFGPWQREIIDIVEFDAVGSRLASAGAYGPHVPSVQRLCDEYLAKPDDEVRIQTGMLHSHPLLIGSPSSKAGPGIGDLGYSEAWFGINETLPIFEMPIIIGTDRPGPVVINPWVVPRWDPTTAYAVDFIVCTVAQAPPREWNPEFEQRVDGSGNEPRVFDADRILDRLRSAMATSCELQVVDDIIRVAALGSVVEVDVPTDGVPVEAVIHRVDGSWIRIGNLPTGAGSLPADGMFERQVADLTLTALAAHGGCARVTLTAPDLGSLTPKEGAERDLLDAETGFMSPEPGELALESSVDAGSAASTGGVSEVEPSTYYARATGLLSDKFHSARIVVVGASGGAYAIEKLARLGPAELTIIDPDVVSIENLVRTSFTLDDVGQAKPHALAHKIGRINPFVHVTPVAKSILMMTDTEVADVMADATVLIAGTDSFEAQATLNTWSLHFGVPAIFIGVHAQAASGIVHWQIPGQTPCQRCMTAGRYAAFAERGREAVDLDGAEGLLVDVQMIDMVATSVVIGLIESGTDTAKARLIEHLGDRTELIIGCDPTSPYISSLVEALTAGLPDEDDPSRAMRPYFGLPILTFASERDPQCPDCKHLWVGAEHVP